MGRLRTVAAIAHTELLLRLRRPSSLALLLLLCALAWTVVPDPASGQALMVRDGQRLAYTSSVVALGTAALASLLVSLLGFYLVSSAIRRDLDHRTGLVLAATPVRSSSYLLGKLLGSAAVLLVVVLVYLVSVLGLHLLRGEGRPDVLLYLQIFLLTCGPAVLITAALALAFECLPGLSGRIGDVAYLFVWIALLSLPALETRRPDAPAWVRCLDVQGLLFTVEAAGGDGPGQGLLVTAGAAGGDGPGQAQQAVDHARDRGLSIGAATFDPALPPIHLPPLALGRAAVLQRLACALLALLPLLLARLGFARFDPARVKAAGPRRRLSPLAWLNQRLRPLATLLLPLLGRGSGTGRLLLGELLLTLMLSPLSLLAALAINLAALFLPLHSVRLPLLPLALLVLAVTVCEMATRDSSAGLADLTASLPRARRWLLPVRLAAAGVMALLLLLVPLVRLLAAEPMAALTLLIGALFVACAAVALGTLAGTPKAFLGPFLLLFYLALNGVPELDFAGWNGPVSNTTRLSFASAAALLGLLALLRQRSAAARWR